jgi:hypothetical protein
MVSQAGQGVGAIDTLSRIWQDGRVVFQAPRGLAAKDVVTLAYDPRSGPDGGPRLTFYVNRQFLYSLNVAEASYQPAFSMTPFQWLRLASCVTDVIPELVSHSFMPLIFEPAANSVDPDEVTKQFGTRQHFAALRSALPVSESEAPDLLFWACAGGPDQWDLLLEARRKLKIDADDDCLLRRLRCDRPTRRPTLLHVAAQTGNVTAVLDLLPVDFENDVLDDSGKTPLHMAARAGLHKVLEKLLPFCRPVIDALDCKGRSALWFAIANGHVECATVLLRYGAKRQLNDKDALACNPTDSKVREPLRDLLCSHDQGKEHAEDIILIKARCSPSLSCCVLQPSVLCARRSSCCARHC